MYFKTRLKTTPCHYFSSFTCDKIESITKNPPSNPSNLICCSHLSFGLLSSPRVFGNLKLGLNIIILVPPACQALLNKSPVPEDFLPTKNCNMLPHHVHIWQIKPKKNRNRWHDNLDANSPPLPSRPDLLSNLGMFVCRWISKELAMLKRCRYVEFMKSKLCNLSKQNNCHAWCESTIIDLNILRLRYSDFFKKRSLKPEHAPALIHRTCQHLNFFGLAKLQYRGGFHSIRAYPKREAKILRNRAIVQHVSRFSCSPFSYPKTAIECTWS